MFLLDATHTSHTRAQTGIQRVVRSVFAQLSAEHPTTGICYDPYQRAWRPLNVDELGHLRPSQISTNSRGAKWSVNQRLRSRFARTFGPPPLLPQATRLIVPELFSAKTGAMLPSLFAKVAGPRIALFHDAIGLKFPEHTPASTVARLPAYLRELLLFDGIAAVSADSADSLRAYWDWLGIKKTPPVVSIPLGLDPASHRTAPADARTANLPRVLCVGTIEGRKNHLALLQACESLWQSGVHFEVELLGLARPDTAAEALAQIDALQSAKRPLHYHGVATDAELHAAYDRCNFTVYPSLIEGFGLPVIESLQHGKPCICSAHGALGESARGGGCLPLNSVDADSFARAIRHLIEAPAALAQLADAAKRRIFPSWKSYTDELIAWTGTLPCGQNP